MAQRGRAVGDRALARQVAAGALEDFDLVGDAAGAVGVAYAVAGGEPNLTLSVPPTVDSLIPSSLEVLGPPGTPLSGPK